MESKFFRNYFIFDELGVGGMSKVYLAFDLKTMQFVAIKFLHQNIQQDAMFVARLKREVNIYRDLNHKNVVDLIEDALDRSPPYMALEYCRGTPLNVLIKQSGRLHPGLLFQILSDITEALHSTHRAGIVHRDLQPGNVILTYMGWCKVIDYGIAKRDDGLVETEPGTIMGTVVYSAPEQNMGSEVDSRADMYSLGLILYEMLTGQKALSGSTLDEIRAEQVDDLDPPSEVADDTPPELDEICEMLTQRMADDRIENATKLLIEIGKLKVGAESLEARLITDPAERRMMAARQAVFEGKWEFVENMCARMMEKNEGGAQTTFFRAKAATQIGKHDLAERMYEKAIFQEPGNIQYLVDYAVALIQRDAYDKARKVLGQVPVGGGDANATRLVHGLLEMLAKRSEWPDLKALEQKDTGDPARTSFIGRLWGKFKGDGT